MRNALSLAFLVAAALIGAALAACGQSIPRPTGASSPIATEGAEQPPTSATGQPQASSVAAISPGSKLRCSPPLDWESSNIDWIDFVELNGIQYVAASLDVGRPLEEGDLRPEFAQVRFKLHGNMRDPSYQPKDGDAAFLGAGTPLYRVKGYNPEFRLAACREGRFLLYEADTNPRARVGGDLLDIEGKVRYIGVNSPQDGTTQLAAIRERGQVSQLVRMVVEAPVDQSFQPGEAGEQHFIAFHLEDGTAVTRAYWPHSGKLSRGIMLPSAFRAAIERAMRADGK